MSMHWPITLEVAVASLDDALAAERAGADRIELCAALELGGLTPARATLVDVKRRCRLPVMAMVRPRAGGFCYSEDDFATMLRDAQLLRANGADGIVFGILNGDGTIDVPRCRTLLRCLGNAQSVFHRAFDATPDPFAALDQLIEMGIARVLTSGQSQSAHEGADLIAELRRRASGRIEVLPGAGIHPLNVTELLQRTGCEQVHGTFRRAGLDIVALDEGVVRDMRNVLGAKTRLGGKGIC